MKSTTTRKTAAAAKADGTRPDHVINSKVIHSPGELPVPEGMKSAQAKLWRAVVELLPDDQIGEADGYQMRELVEVWDMLQQVKKILLVAPLNKEALDAFKTYNRIWQSLANQFGLTPVARRQIEITPAAQPASETVSAQDTFSEILERLSGDN